VADPPRTVEQRGAHWYPYPLSWMGRGYSSSLFSSWIGSPLFRPKFYASDWLDDLLCVDRVGLGRETLLRLRYLLTHSLSHSHWVTWVAKNNYRQLITNVPVCPYTDSPIDNRKIQTLQYWTPLLRHTGRKTDYNTDKIKSTSKS